MLTLANQDFARLVENAPGLWEMLLEWVDDPAMQPGCDALAEALNRADMSAPIFKDKNLANFALMAYHQEKITLAQCSTVIMLWCAIADYQQDMQNLRYYPLAGNLTNQKRVSKFMQIETMPTFGFKREFTKEQFRSIFTELSQASIPASENGFFVFSLPSKELLKPIVRTILNIKFTLFFPIDTGTEIRVIVPTHSLLQLTINTLPGDPITLVPKIGDDTAANIYTMHRTRSHPIGLSVPGYEHEKADGQESGKDGFVKHDVPYHVSLLKSIPVLQPLQHLLGLSQHYIKQQPKVDRPPLENVIIFLTDAEFRGFLNMSTNMGSTNDHPFLRKMNMIKSKEGSLILCLAMTLRDICFLKNVRTELVVRDIGLYQVSGPYADRLKAHREEHFAVLYNWLAFCLLNMLNNAKRYEQFGIHLPRLISAGLDILPFFTEISQAIVQAMQLTQQQGLLTAFYDGCREYTKFFKEFILGTTARAIEYRRQLNNSGKALLDACLAARNQLFELAKKGDVAALTEFLASKTFKETLIHVDLTDAESKTPAYYSVRNGHLAATELLLQHGVMMELPFSQGESQQGSFLDRYATRLLHIATQNRDGKMIGCLLAAGARCYVYDEKEMTPIDYAIVQGDSEIVLLYLQYMSIDNKHIAYLRQKHKLSPEIEQLLTEYQNFKNELWELYERAPSTADAPCSEEFLSRFNALKEKNNNRFSWHSAAEQNKTLLPLRDTDYVALDNNKVKYLFTHPSRNAALIRLLLAQKYSRLDVKDPAGNTLFIQFLEQVTESELLLVQECVQSGVRLDTVSTDGKNPICQSIARNVPSIAEFLVLHCSHLSNDFTYGTLTLAMKELIAKNTSLTWPDEYTSLFTALVKKIGLLNQPYLTSEAEEASYKCSFWTVIRNNPVYSYYKTVSFGLFSQPIGGATPTLGKNQIGLLDAPLALRQLCVELGADPNDPDFQGGIELITAVNNDWYEYAELLIRKGANVDAIDNELNTALHIAAAAGKLNFVDLLLRNGAKQFMNEHDQSPMQLAQDNGHANIARRLQAAAANAPALSKTFIPVAMAERPVLAVDSDAEAETESISRPNSPPF